MKKNAILSGVQMLCVLFCFCARDANADGNDDVRQDEWAAWPAFCRARQASIWGDSGYSPSVSQADIAHWKEALGAAFEHIHHYCWALNSYNRAKAATDPQRQTYYWNRVIDDATYAFKRIGPADTLSPDIAWLLAEAFDATGNAAKGEAVLRDVQSAQPNAARPYVALALLLKRQGKLPEAVRWLERGNRTTEFKSAEINYTLGLFLIDQKRFEEAKECAVRAYALGYPLPGLKEKLRRAGHWD